MEEFMSSPFFIEFICVGLPFKFRKVKYDDYFDSNTVIYFQLSKKKYT